ncbi:MAG: beta-propeller fold lactonase family protein [Bryobacterales bacterium]|nr:beta-propeller fold lactonase family protein [Bryobacterales bacterium]
MILRLSLVVLLALTAFTATAAPKRPVYVGVKACGACHDGASMGHQYSKWLLSKHAQGYSALMKPESREITKISGLRGDPWKEPVCLGCHSTASTAEEWEKDDTFKPEDGLQCEACHGPGSEYMAEDVMRNRAEAMKNGLKLPTKEHCLGCHIEKGTHVNVLKNSTVNIDKVFSQIQHPLPKPSAIATLPEGRGGNFIGSRACGACHKGPEHGHQYDVWRMGKHARAWAVLSTPRATEIATQMKVTAEPRAAAQCLGCHAVGAEIEEGVGCEACHGAGKAYATDAIMRNPLAAKKAGLLTPTRQGCNHCHRETHGKPFNPDAAWAANAHPSKIPPPVPEPQYKTPLNMSFRPKSTELWIAFEAAGAVGIVDTRTQRKIAEIPTGGAATEVAFTPDGRRAFVSNRQDDTVSVIDAATRKVTQTLKVGDEPHGLLTDAQGKLLYVLNSASDDIYVYDAITLKWIKKLSAGRSPWSLSLSPDGASILVTNTLSHITGFRKPLKSEVTVIETERAIVTDRWMVPGANLMMGVAWHPTGQFALATLNRTKNMVPMTRLMQGWTITNGLAVLWADGTVDQVLLDTPGMGFADATDVAFTPDGRYALATSSGTDRVAVIDCARLTQLVKDTSKEDRKSVLPNHLGKSADFIVKYLPVKSSPRGISVAPDGLAAYVANAIDDSLTVINLKTLQPAARIDLGGAKVITKQRFGEKTFHSANIAFRKQFSCHSCHPDGHVDGLTYDIEADGIGVSPVENRTLRGILDTAPFKWEGTNVNLSRQCGARLSVFFTRNQPFTPEELSAIDYYITAIPRPPNRYHTPGEKYTPAQRRGKAIFERTMTADGSVIPPEGRCITCHMPPYFTTRQIFDVGTKQALDRTGKFDTPHLNNIYDSAPFLHNGMADTLEQIWTDFNPYDKHGFTNDLTKDQLNDLIEYIKTL